MTQTVNSVRHAQKLCKTIIPLIPKGIGQSKMQLAAVRYYCRLEFGFSSKIEFIYTEC